MKTARHLKRAAFLALAAASVGLMGCGTLITQIDGPLFAPRDRAFDWDRQPVSPVYAGTRLSFGGARKSEVKYVWVTDMPFSFTADTAILPVTLVQELYWRFFGREAEEVEVLTPKATQP